MLKNIQQRDKIKKEWCHNNDINFLEIPHTEFNNIEILLNNFIKMDMNHQQV
jgi:hypothetical protein